MESLFAKNFNFSSRQDSCFFFHERDLHCNFHMLYVLTVFIRHFKFSKQATSLFSLYHFTLFVIGKFLQKFLPFRLSHRKISGITRVKMEPGELTNPGSWHPYALMALCKESLETAGMLTLCLTVMLSPWLISAHINFLHHMCWCRIPWLVDDRLKNT